MQPKSAWDWLAFVCTWIGSVVLALRAAGAPLLPGAPMFLAANFWNFVPVALISVAGLIYLYRAAVPALAATQPVSKPEPRGMSIRLTEDPNEKSLRSLRRARDNAAVAAQQGTMRSQSKAYHELDAAMTTIEKNFGIAPISPPEAVLNGKGVKVVLEFYVRYVDAFSPMLREGHVGKAREKAEAFNYPWKKRA